MAAEDAVRRVRQEGKAVEPRLTLDYAGSDSERTASMAQAASHTSLSSWTDSLPTPGESLSVSPLSSDYYSSDSSSPAASPTRCSSPSALAVKHVLFERGEWPQYRRSFGRYVASPSTLPWPAPRSSAPGDSCRQLAPEEETETSAIFESDTFRDGGGREGRRGHHQGRLLQRALRRLSFPQPRVRREARAGVLQGKSILAADAATCSGGASAAEAMGRVAPSRPAACRPAGSVASGTASSAPTHGDPASGEAAAVGRSVAASCRAAITAVKAGDEAALLALLAACPAAAHARSSLTCGSLLHEAVAARQQAVVEVLLRGAGGGGGAAVCAGSAACGWQVDLEARNMFGETPLHVAAKSGSAEAVRRLLQHGARVDAASSTRATALHLAVLRLHSAITCAPARAEGMDGEVAEAPAVVEALLQHHPNASLQDKSGASAAALIHSKLGRLTPQLAAHKRAVSWLQTLALQAQASSAPSAGAPAAPHSSAAELERCLARLVGLPGLKQQLRGWARALLLDERRRQLLGAAEGAAAKALSRRPAPHMAFLGSPGTGKTSVARLLAQVLQRVGLLRCARVVEVQRSDLVGEFVGHTGPKTRQKIQEASGGVLFVDEAYRLVPQRTAGDTDFGVEALEEVMAAMDTGDVVVIFAGYRHPMQRLFAANEGLQRRVQRVFEFEDLSPAEIARVMRLQMAEAQQGLWEDGANAASSGSRSMNSEDWNCAPAATQNPLAGFRLHTDCTEEALASAIASLTSEAQRRRQNGGLALPVLLGAREQLDERLPADCCCAAALATIELRDVEAALRALPRD